MRTNVAIVGAGPAGMYCAWELKRADADIGVVIVEKGYGMRSRECPATEECDCKPCAILCGTGGAGGLSDGKNTISVGRGTQGEDLFRPEDVSIMREVDDSVAAYAGGGGVVFDGKQSMMYPEFSRLGFVFSSYPLRHLGSDGIRRWADNMRRDLFELGVEFIDATEAASIVIRDGHAPSVALSDGGVLFGDVVVAATGLDGAPWLHDELVRLGCSFKPGPAGIALRLEAPADALAPLFDAFYDWKMERGRLRSFCCNNRGFVLNENHASLGVRNVNGHSFLNPTMKTESSNFAIMAKVTTAMTEDPQGMVVGLARAVNGEAGGHTVVQRVEDFLCGRKTMGTSIMHNEFITNNQARPRVDIGRCLDGIDGLARDYRDYILTLDRLVPGVIGEFSVVYAPEVKYYSPRVALTPGWQSVDVPGLYVIGNASGYLDSLVAAATSWILAARDINGE
jgi:uncharacterized FAD-dependent dehydrogenase